VPEQKGKKRKPQRRRSSGDAGPSYTPPAQSDSSSRPERGARPVMRGRMNAPLWINLLVGPIMIIAGLWFGLLQPGAQSGWRLALLAGYLVVGGWYLYRAAQQIRARREQ
jgi:hypothetical protein